MPRFGTVPPEPKPITSLDGLAPKFRAAVERVLAANDQRVISESLRTIERQAWLYGFGREWDDGRGIVTHASGTTGWHPYGLAVDIIHRKKGWDAPMDFWEALGADAEREGLVWGGRWKMRDLPHVQFGAPMRTTPSAQAAHLAADGGLVALWRAVGAD